MIRSLFGFAAFAVFALIALKLVAALFGVVFGLLGTIIWFAFWGFIFYLILRVLSPSTADRVKEVISGKRAA